MAALSVVVRGPVLPTWARTAGLVPLLAGAGLVLRGARLFERVGTNICTVDDPDRLVESGPFRWTRNPMYLGFVGLLVGAALLLGTAAAWLGPVVFVVAADRWYVPFEERRMAARFGPAYDEYRSRVPRWIALPWR